MIEVRLLPTVLVWFSPIAWLRLFPMLVLWLSPTVTASPPVTLADRFPSTIER
ncbi:hypothetical protein WMF20_35730 [Sorangium sp. So ce834]